VQIRAVENLLHTGVMVHPAVMVSFSTHHEIEELRNRLGMIDVNFKDVEIEELVMYDDVKKRLKQVGIFHGAACTPDRIPPEQVCLVTVRHGHLCCSGGHGVSPLPGF